MDSGIETLVTDEEVMSLWEVLRRCNGGVGLDRLIERTQRTSDEIQRRLDQLEQNGLVRAERSRNGSTYVPIEVTGLTAQMIAVVTDGVRKLSRDRTRRQLRGLLDGQGPSDAEDSRGGFGMSVRLGPAELAEVSRRIEDLRRFLQLTQQSGRSGRGRRTDGPVQCTHHVVVQVLPAPPGELPLPDGSLQTARGNLPPGSRPIEALSPRERQVAMALMAGQTMRQVAETLGLSFFTVDTLVRRVYRKLGVKRRTEFIMRMRDAERD
jgi:DNA-binding CsgD family transcriptional regulator/DNA-binding MarR family transcriptional regulator